MRKRKIIKSHLHQINKQLKKKITLHLHTVLSFRDIKHFITTLVPQMQSRNLLFKFHAVANLCKHVNAIDEIELGETLHLRL